MKRLIGIVLVAGLTAQLRAQGAGLHQTLNLEENGAESCSLSSELPLQALALPVSPLEAREETIHTARESEVVPTFSNRAPLEILRKYGTWLPTFSTLYAENGINLDAFVGEFIRQWHGIPSEEKRAAFFASFPASYAGMGQTTLPQLLKGAGDFAETALTENDPHATEFLSKLGRIVGGQIANREAETLTKRWRPRSQSSPNLAHLPALDLASGPYSIRYLRRLDGSRVILADWSPFVAGMLEEAKRWLGIGDSVVIRQVDVRNAEALFREPEYRFVRMENIDTYVSKFEDVWYRSLLSRIPEGGEIVVSFPSHRAWEAKILLDNGMAGKLYHTINPNDWEIKTGAFVDNRDEDTYTVNFVTFKRLVPRQVLPTAQGSDNPFRVLLQGLESAA